MLLILQLYLEYHLKPTWDWLNTVMDSTEAQLRFGSALSENTEPSHPNHPLYASYMRTQREARHATPPNSSTQVLNSVAMNGAGGQPVSGTAAPSTARESDQRMYSLTDMRRRNRMHLTRE